MGDDTEVKAGRTPERDAQARDLLERTHDPARVLALTDGVFAVVITLLVLEIHVPELTQGHSLAEALAEVRPSFNAFVVTFVLTGMYWVGHRDLVALIRRTDRGLVWVEPPTCCLQDSGQPSTGCRWVLSWQRRWLSRPDSAFLTGGLRPGGMTCCRTRSGHRPSVEPVGQGRAASPTSPRSTQAPP